MNQQQAKGEKRIVDEVHSIESPSVVISCPDNGDTNGTLFVNGVSQL